jgi:adhesin transport system outer membrane protein
MPAFALAQSDGDALRMAARKALAQNPDVTSRQNALRAAEDAVAVARGPLYPRVDLEADVGHTSDRFSNRTPSSDSLSRSGVSLSLNQLVWDGLATMHDTRRAGHDRLTRQFELIDTAEQTALEASRAVYDVLRYRRLVQLAEDNYVQHKLAQAQIQQRFQAGVGRGVDLEQVGARVALAEANLTAEQANLHDVSARYQRVVGEAPPNPLSLPAPLSQGIAPNADAAVGTAISRSPAISAAIENLRAQRAIVGIRDAAFQPRVEARLRSGSGRNFDGVPEQKRDTSAELVLNWNLFNGGADRARVRQQANLLNQAADLRDRACRDTRQTTEIAFNDTRKLTEQLVSLDRNALAIEKARDAYRQQFVIGQRSLLDLLNAENELYTAKRSYANADYDLGIAYVRTQAAMQQLLPSLGVTTPDAGIAQVNLDGWNSGEDAPTRCPGQAVTVSSTERRELDARAQQLQPQVPALPKR